MSRPVAARAALATVLAVAMAALAFGAIAGGMPARDPVLHAPVIAGGPTGRVALDGRWAVRVLPSPDARAVHVPYSPNARVVSGPAGEASFEGGVAWYRTTFTVAAPGDYAIRFESVNHEASVFVDGRLAARRPRPRRPRAPFGAAHRGGGCVRRGPPPPPPPRRVPAVRGAQAPRRRPARPDGPRRLALARGDAGRRVAPHVVQLRRHRP